MKGELQQSDKARYNESLKLKIKSALVEKFQKGDERPCNENDFLETKKNREKITADIQILLQNFLDNLSNQTCNSDIENELLASILILCGQNVTLHHWNTEPTVKNCEVIQFHVVNLFNCRDMSEFVSKNCKNNIIKAVFKLLCPDLTVSTWRHFPASVVCFMWILEMIKQPNLSLYLQFVLPPALLLTDDYINENKIIGIRCLDHIIQNITIAELQFCGHGNVIYSALMPLLRIREAELIQITIPPLVSLTTKLEFDLKNKDYAKWSKFDDILEIFLENMELEQVINMRNCYISNLGLLVGASGSGIIRWSKRLLRIFQEYIQTATKYKDENTINCCLKVIENYVQVLSKTDILCAESLLVTLMLALHYMNTFASESQKEENKEIAVNCIAKLLKSLSESERNDFEKMFQDKFSCDVNLKI